MAYSKLLNRIISKTNYSNVEIAQKCKELGINVDRTYINKLLNGKSKPPKDQISRAIAKICGADERLLVLEGYIDKAPKEIIEALQQIRYLTAVAALNIFENKINDIFLGELQIQLESEPLADFILEILDKKATDITFDEISGISFSETNNNYNITLTTPTDITVKDDAMSPIIPMNAHINLKIKQEYENGDIIAFKIKGTEDLLVRYIFYSGKQIMLTAINKDCAPMVYNANDIIILGRVTKVISEI